MTHSHYGSGRHRKPRGTGFHRAGVFKDVPVFRPGPGSLDPDVLTLFLNYPDSAILQALLLETQSFSLNATLPSIDFAQELALVTSPLSLAIAVQTALLNQNQRIDSSVTQLFVVLPGGTFDNPGSLFPTALSLAVTLNDITISQGQTLIPSTLQLNLGLPNGTLVQPLRLTPSATTLFLNLPNSLMRSIQFLTPSALTLNASLPASTLDQNDNVLQTSVLTLNSSIPNLTLSQNQRLAPTVLNLTATLPASVLSQPNTQVLPTTALTLNLALPNPTALQAQRLTPTALTLNAAAPSASLIQPESLTPSALSLSATLPAPSVTQDSGVTESISATGVALRGSQLQDISVMGDVDWWIAGVDEKSGGTAITVTGGTTSTSTGAPIFKFNDGTTNTGNQQLTSQYNFGTIIPPLITVAIPAGSGRVSVWVGTGSVNDATFSAAFGLNFTGLINFSGDDRFDIDFVAASATTMAITLVPGSNADAGIYAVALATNTILTGTPAPDILWWPTTEATGTNIYDPINGWIGFFEGTTISWDVDNFLLWAGGYVRNNNGALESLIETTSAGTAVCWVNPNDLTNDACIFTAKNNTTNEGRMYFLRGDPSGASGGGTNVYKGGYRTDPTSGAQGTQFESANNDWALGWNHIAMSFATGSEALPRFQFWKNGVLLPQANYTFYPTQFPDNTIHSQGNFIYGQQGNRGNPFSGKLYDLRLYSRELETVEIQRIFDATRDVVGVT